MSITQQQLFENSKQEGKVIPAIRDTIFKRMMINHIEYLAVILENVMGIPKEDIIQDGVFLNNELPSNHFFKKSSISDLTLQVGNMIITLEANYKYSTALEIRNRRHLLDVTSKEYSRKDKKDFQKSIYQVLFNNYSHISNELVLHIHLKDEDNITIPDEIFTIIHLNLVKAKNLYYNKEKLDKMSKYLVILLLEKKEEILEIARGDEILEKVAKDILSYSEKLEVLDNFLHEVDEETFVENYAYEKMQEGIEQGTLEEKKKNAKAMLEEDIPIQTISKILGLSVDEIKNLN